MTGYRVRVLQQLLPILAGIGVQRRALDFGSGDGWFASQIAASGFVEALEAVDVKRRSEVLVEPRIYDGTTLPFPDASFDLIYSVDVLHHCADPFAQLAELTRVARRYLLIKDHRFTSEAGRWTLALLDELGNRRFGIPSPYHYQQGWSWRERLQKLGWVERTLIHPCPCHIGPLGAATNALQYIALYERAAS